MLYETNIYIYASPPKPTFLWLSCWFSCWCLCVRGRDMQIGRGIADKRKYCILIVCQRQTHANNFVHIYRLVVSKGIADKNVSDCLWWWNFVFSWHLHDNASCSKQWSIDRRIFFCDGWSIEIKPSFWRHAMYTQCRFEAIDPHSCANTRIGHCEFWHAAEAFQLGNVGLNESCLWGSARHGL